MINLTSRIKPVFVYQAGARNTEPVKPVEPVNPAHFQLALSRDVYEELGEVYDAPENGSEEGNGERKIEIERGSLISRLAGIFRRSRVKINFNGNGHNGICNGNASRIPKINGFGESYLSYGADGKPLIVKSDSNYSTEA